MSFNRARAPSGALFLWLYISRHAQCVSFTIQYMADNTSIVFEKSVEWLGSHPNHGQLPCAQWADNACAAQYDVLFPALSCCASFTSTMGCTKTLV